MVWYGFSKVTHNFFNFALSDWQFYGYFSKCISDIKDSTSTHCVLLSWCSDICVDFSKYFWDGIKMAQELLTKRQSSSVFDVVVNNISQISWGVSTLQSYFTMILVFPIVELECRTGSWRGQKRVLVKNQKPLLFLPVHQFPDIFAWLDVRISIILSFMANFWRS